MNKLTQLLCGVVLLGLMAVPAAEAIIDGDLTVGAEFSYFKYEEPGVMEEAGPMYGIFGKYVLRGHGDYAVGSWGDFIAGYKENFMAGADLKLAYAQVDYESQSTGTLDDIDDYLIEVRAVTGYDFPVLTDTVLTPYVGIGYRYLNDKSGGRNTTTGHFGYDRESEYVYVPFGFTTETPLSSQWVANFNIEYDFFVHGNQQSHLEDVSALLNTLQNDQEEGYGVRGSVQFARETGNMEVLFGPYIKYWDVDDSNIGTVTCGLTPCALGYEPKNESFEYGLTVGARF